MAKKIQVVQVSTRTDFNQLDEREQFSIIGQLTSFAAASNVDFRILSFVRPWKPEKWRQARAKLAQRAPYPWQKRGIQEELRLGETVTSRIELKSINHYMILYDYAAGASDLRAWGLDARPAYPPLPLEGGYAAHIDHLYPLKVVDGQQVYDNTRPYAMLMAAYELKDKWHWTTLSNLLTDASGPMVLCIDTERVSRRQIEFAVNGWQAASADVTRISDKETVLNLQDSDFIMTATSRGQGLHNTRIVMMLLDNDLKRLRERMVELRTKLSPYMNITTLSGAQDKAAMLFSPQHNPSGVPDIRHNVLSPGVGRMMGVLGFSHKEKYDGIYMGVGRGLNKSITGLTYINPWVDQQASHMLCLGKTGFGKTVGMQAFCARQAELGAQVIFMEPQGHSKRLRAYLGDENALYNKVSYNTLTYNPLDVVAPTFADQFDYFIVLLEFLLNPRGDDGKRPMRFLTNIEMAAINEALEKTYQGYNWETLLNDQSVTPLFGIFVAWLKKFSGGAELADELGRLYITGPWSKTFNATSTLQVRLRRQNGAIWPAVIYDFSEISKIQRPLFYFIILAGINREARRPLAAGQERPRRLVVIDEFRYLTGGTNLVEWVADQVATSRSFRVAYCLIDQNPRTLAGVSADGAQVIGDADDLTSRQHLLDNIRYILSFRLEENAAKVMAQLYPDLNASHIHFLTQAGVGEALLKDGENVSLVDFMLRASEQKHFLGS